MNLETSRLLIPYFRNAFSVCRTQESGSSETRHRRRRTRRPRRRPSWNQMVSAIRAATTQHVVASSTCRRPVRMSAPAASSSGIEGTGIALCSASTQKNSSEYPCRSTNAIAWLIARWSDITQFPGESSMLPCRIAVTFQQSARITGQTVKHKCFSPQHRHDCLSRKAEGSRESFWLGEKFIGFLQDLFEKRLKDKFTLQIGWKYGEVFMKLP